MTAGETIDYEAIAQTAMRGVVRSVLAKVAKSGLPGEHHFYIAFNTRAPGVGISKRLKEKYPEEMTIVLQHRFWDLAVSDERFEVKLTFDSIPERLTVPFSAVKVFFDPSVPYGLQFEDPESDGGGRLPMGTFEGNVVGLGDPQTQPGERTGPPRAGRAVPPAAERSEKKPRAPRRPRADKTDEPATAAPQGQRTPPDAPARHAANEGAATKPEEPEHQAPANDGDGDGKVVSLEKFRKK